MKIKDRIKSFRRVRAADLMPNPKNWRVHPENQHNALRGILAEVGWADAVLARETKDGLMLIDGHLRAEVAPDEKVPVLVLDVDADEADKILATHDPLAAMATADAAQLESLLGELEFENEDLQKMLDELAQKNGMFSIDGTDASELPNGDKEPFQQMTFTLHDTQAESVRRALDKAKDDGQFHEMPNENCNGNALTLIAETYLGVG